VDKKTREDFIVMCAGIVGTVMLIYMVKTLISLPGLP
jgi:hypothetical protein